MATRSETVNYVAAVFRRFPDADPHHLDLNELGKVATSLHRLAEHECNYGLTPRQDKRQDALSDRARELANKMGLAIYIQGDPRGCPLYLIPADGQHHESDYNSVGVAVPA